MDDFDKFLDDVANAKATQSGNNFTDGKGRAVVTKIEFENKNGGPTFVLEAKIERSEKIPVVSMLTDQPLAVEPNAPGTSASIVVVVSGNENDKKAKLGNIKSVVLSLLGFDEAAVTPQQFKDALAKLKSKEQPATGMLFDYETYRKTNKPRTREYCRVKVVHVPPAAGNSGDEIKARRVTIGG